MIDRELKRLNRAELLELLLESTARCEALQQELNRANELLADRALAVEQSGTLAEAALRLSGVFASADEAAALYRENAARLQSEAEDFCAARIAEAEKQAAEIIKNAELRRAELLSEFPSEDVSENEYIKISLEDDQ